MLCCQMPATPLEVIFENRLSNTNSLFKIYLYTSSSMNHDKIVKALTLETVLEYFKN